MNWRRVILRSWLKNVILMDVTEFLFASIEEVILLLDHHMLVWCSSIVEVYIFLQDFRSTLIPMIAVPVLIGIVPLPLDLRILINLLTLSAQPRCHR